MRLDGSAVRGRASHTFGADCAALKDEAWPDVTDEAENIRSASRKRLIRRMAPLLACLPR